MTQVDILGTGNQILALKPKTLILSIRRVSLPVPRRILIRHRKFKQFLKNTFAIVAVGHYYNTHLLFRKKYCIMLKAVPMTFLEYAKSIWRLQTAPSQGIAKGDMIIIGCRIFPCLRAHLKPATDPLL